MKEFLSEDNMSNKKSIKDFNIYSKKFYKKGNKTLKRSLAVFFTSLGATLILLVIAGTIILHSFLGQIERNPFDPGNIKIPESAKDVYEGQDVVNIALLRNRFALCRRAEPF